MFDTRLMRLEDEMTDGRYEVRAEIPASTRPRTLISPCATGSSPSRPNAVRRKEFDGRSEFSYGSFIRTVSLPAGANEDDIKATYDKGILTVSVGVSEPASAEKHVEIPPSSRIGTGPGFIARARTHSGPHSKAKPVSSFQQPVGSVSHSSWALARPDA